MTSRAWKSFLFSVQTKGRTTKATRPSDNVVLKSCTDSDLARYIRDIAKFPSLSTEEEREVAKRVKAGDEEAKKELIQACLIHQVA